MPAWIAGIEVCKDASGNTHVNLIPALHAGMTQSRGSALDLPKPIRPVFSVREGHEEPEASNQKKCFRPPCSHMESFRPLRKFTSRNFEAGGFQTRPYNSISSCIVCALCG
jgi:hypothetical protein